MALNLHWKQPPAFAEADASPPDEKDPVVIWSLESGRAGKRQFVAASRTVFFAHYKEMAICDRSWYELIREDHPCHAYFDIEYAKALNPTLDAEEMTQRFCAFVVETLAQNYPKEAGGENAVKVHILDASDEKKMSKHVIMHVGESMFANNQDFQRFVVRHIETQCKALGLTIMAKPRKGVEGGPTEVVFYDTGVYSLNRNMRLIYSSKLADAKKEKPRMLLAPGGKGDDLLDDKEELFMRYLITRPHVYRPTHLVCAASDEKVVRTTSKKRARVGKSTVPPRFRAICNLITEAIRRRCDMAEVYNQLFSEDDRGMCLSIYLLYSKCENAGREHGSTHIYYIVNLTEEWISQMCSNEVCNSGHIPRMELEPEWLAALHLLQGGEGEGGAEGGDSGDGDGDEMRWGVDMDLSMHGFSTLVRAMSNK